MQDTSPPAPPATRQAVEAHDRSAPGQVTGRLAKALACMVWDGNTRDQAAAAAGMSVHGLREALRKPHVKAHLKAELQVLRDSERARNIHALADVRDHAKNATARVAAARALEGLSEEGERDRRAAPFMGLVVNILPAPNSGAPLRITVADRNGDSSLP